MKPSAWQILLIVSGVITTILLGIFFHREVSPEYRIYQDKYIELENFRSSYMHEPPPPFQVGVKQIVIEKEDKGPAEIDRCISCHVALQIEDFSPTRIARDINGNVVFDAFGFPKKEENPNYIWKRLDERIQELEAKEENAESLKEIKTANVGHFTYNVEKVLQMHPLMGRETRPFEYHPIEEYGCTSCHGGNGRGLVTDRAHGPVFDEQYEVEFQGYRPQFLEADPDNDPKFARVFNDKPGHRLLFQTNPIYVGALIQAKCMQCHQGAESTLRNASGSANRILLRNERESLAIRHAFEQEKNAVRSLAELKHMLAKDGYDNTLKALQAKEEDFSLPSAERNKVASQIKFLKTYGKERALSELQSQLVQSFGSPKLAKAFVAFKAPLDQFIKETQGSPEAMGSLYRKADSLNLSNAILQHVADVKESFQTAVHDEEVIGGIQTDVDRLTRDYQHGKDLFISQACYACHKIAGFSRGGVGPELTQAGHTYPWYLKQKISYPQFDLHTSTMPNYRVDHDELEDLVTYLLAQVGPGKKLSDVAYKAEVAEWEAGKKQPWEEAITPSQIHDLRYGMTVFAVEGCAACHRLRGFESDVGFQVEKNKPSFETLYNERKWFKKLFPEFVRGSEVVAVLERDGNEINQRIVDHVRENSTLEEIAKKHPGAIEALYTNFKYASRAQNHRITELMAKEKDESKKALLAKELKDWKDLVRRVLMVYIQEYGLGRIICPRPNWSGVYRTDQWLMEHFRNPTSHVPRSIMPVFPFDDTKFYALTYMLDVLGQRNNQQDQEVWQHNGFNPEMAFQKYCSQCHGEYLFGNGPVSEWIYPIPKNLRKAEFLRNLTKENALQSITHGVKGTPMPPWGELGDDKPFANKTPILSTEQIHLLVDWLFSFLPGGTIIKGSEEVPKWQYEPEDVLKELYEEGGELKDSTHSFLQKERDYLVSLIPIPMAAAKAAQKKVEDVFDEVKKTLPDGTPQTLYYIKKKYYTPENILQGQQLFYEHCAPCHGREADGAGLRAEAMREAKPRMLVNLDWLQTRDDLRLIRSIKFGVPGTAMTPWGDQTSSLQRLQLVMFIRSLSMTQEEKTEFIRAIYKVFDNAEFLVERARVEEYSHLAILQKELSNAKQLRETLDRGTLANPSEKQSAIEAYQKELDLSVKLEEKEKADALFQDLRQKIKQEKELYSASGLGFLAAGIDSAIIDQFLKLIELNENRFELKDKQLLWSDKNFNAETFRSLKDNIESSLVALIKAGDEQKTILSGKLASAERTRELQEFEARIDGIKKQKARFLSNLAEAMRLKDEEKQILEAINKTGGIS